MEIGRGLSVPVHKAVPPRLPAQAGGGQSAAESLEQMNPLRHALAAGRVDGSVSPVEGGHGQTILKRVDELIGGREDGLSLQRHHAHQAVLLEGSPAFPQKEIRRPGGGAEVPVPVQEPLASVNFRDGEPVLHIREIVIQAWNDFRAGVVDEAPQAVFFDAMQFHGCDGAAAPRTW